VAEFLTAAYTLMTRGECFRSPVLAAT